MKVDHALRDLYDHERDLRLLMLLQFLFVAVTAIAMALDDASIALFGLLAVIVLLSLQKGTVKDGIHRKLWQYLTGGLNGVPLKTNRDALEPYRVTDESDLEDLEE